MIKGGRERERERERGRGREGEREREREWMEECERHYASNTMEGHDSHVRL